MSAEAVNGYPYKFSIVSAVYKVEEYLEEYIESLLRQTLDFEHNVQLILVDDGSPDNSGAICDRYAERYPNNIKVVHKENGGVSSARNAGLALVAGEYVGFCDSDDMLSSETLAAVYRFFDAHKEETDVVSIPIELFGAQTGEHPLNANFAGGERVISLDEEWKTLQGTVANLFVKAEAARTMCFITALAVCEGAEQAVRLFLQRPRLGVVCNCCYLWRAHTAADDNRLFQNKAWYVNAVRHFSLAISEAAIARYGSVPYFVQNAVAYELQWKLNLQKVPLTVISREEYEEFVRLARKALSYLADEILQAQTALYKEILWTLLGERYGGRRFPIEEGDVCYGEERAVYRRFSETPTEWSLVEISADTVRLSLRQTLLGEETLQGLYLDVANQRISPLDVSDSVYMTCFGNAVARYAIAVFEIPRTLLSEERLVTLHAVLDGVDITMQNGVSGRFFPIEPAYRNAYYSEKGLLLTLEGCALRIKQTGAREVRRRRRCFLRELWSSGTFGAKKAVAARILAGVVKKMSRREIWIVSDRVHKGGDNGEAFFRYLKASRYKRAKYYFAVNRGSTYDKLKPLGGVVETGSWKYKILFLAASKIISSQADETVNNPFDYYFAIYKDVMNAKKFVFLQHGVIKDDLSGWLQKYNKNIHGFVCTARPEYDSIVGTPSYYYTEKDVWLTGLARFDRLYRDEKKYITVMPTWRRHLMGVPDKKTGAWSVGDGFADSTYFRFYNALINDGRLLRAAEEYGYTVCYMPHPITLPQINLFRHDARVKFFSPDDEYRDMYAQSNLVLTDYSSAVFDFAYLRKPIVYAQFDREEFFGNHTYTEGYFDYECDGFGEVTYDLESTVDVLIDYMKNGCAMKDEYRARADRFFAFDDQNNCQRIVDMIEKME